MERLTEHQVRDYSIDNLRALAIFAVVFGHSIILYSSQWSLYTTSIEVPFLDVTKKIINIIQMPLFFSISGFLFYFTEKKKELYEIILDKLRRIGIPFVFFSFAWLLPIRYILGYSGYKSDSFFNVIFYKILLGGDNGHLWYLPTLFFCFIISYLCLHGIRKLVRKNREYVYIVIIAAILYCVKILFPFGGYLQFIGQYYIWFCLGILISHYKKGTSTWKKWNKYRGFLIVASIFFICFALWKPNIIFVNIATVFCTIALYLIIPSNKNEVLIKLSKNSFGIYLFHSPMIYNI